MTFIIPYSRLVWNYSKVANSLPAVWSVIKGVPVYVQPYDENRWQITGLCSTNLAHFLRADLQPGAFIPLFQQTK